MKHDPFRVTLQFSDEQIADLLCSALEGGSNYWYMIQDEVKPKKWDFFGTYNKDKTKYAHLIPFNEGGALLIDDENADDPELKTPVRLDIERLRTGLILWAQDVQKPDDDKTRSSHPSYFSAFLKDDADAEVADIFLQYCIFGKVIYG